MKKTILLFLGALLSVGAFAAELKDGEYKATRDKDKHGWNFAHVIQVKGGKIVSSTLEYTNDKGDKKSTDVSYNEGMKKKTGVTMTEVMKQLDEDFVKTQMALVDNIAGATHTVYEYKESAKLLLEAAQKGDTKEIRF